MMYGGGGGLLEGALIKVFLLPGGGLLEGALIKLFLFQGGGGRLLEDLP